MGFFDLDGVRLMLAKPSGEHDHPGATLSFRVDDIESIHETVAAGGVSFDQGAQHDCRHGRVRTVDGAPQVQ